MNVLMDIGAEFWATLGEMAPYLLFGFLVAGVLSIMVSPDLVERHLGGRGIWPVFKASLFGVPLPLCSCSVIPVAASLRRHGSSKGATTAFLLSTPQTGADSILATFSLLGPVFAIFRPIAAFASGVLGGSIVEAVGKAGGDIDEKEECTDECCAHTGEHGKFMRIVRYGFITLPRDIGKPLLVGLLVAGVIAAFVPADFFSDVLGTGILAMVVMMLLGMPIYVCATASIPVAAAMMMKGATPGAALVFLMTGPATNAAAIVTLWKILGKRTAVVYLGVLVFTSLGSGLLLDRVFAAVDIPAVVSSGLMLPPAVKTVAAFALLAVLGVAIVGERRHKEAT